MGARVPNTDTVHPWIDAQARIVGGVVWFRVSKAISLPSGLPGIRLLDPPPPTGPAYVPYTKTSTANDVKILLVLVDLSTRKVVEISTTYSGRVTPAAGYVHPTDNED